SRCHTSFPSCCLELSPYLTNGHISPVEVVQRVRKANICEAVKNAFLNRVFILRELSINVIWFNKNYDSLFGCNLPKWALDSIK
uniref:Uncharacterized protein n=1 Tax=Romanomermis culicivorax TaxID=13658 RepID=A0A915KN92_ROMCU